MSKEITTKKEAILEFIKDLQERIKKLGSSSVTLNDYTVLREYFNLVEIPEEIIKEAYQTCDLDSWEDIYNKRNNKDYKDQIECANANIKGIARAVKIRLEEYLAKSK